MRSDAGIPGTEASALLCADATDVGYVTARPGLLVSNSTTISNANSLVCHWRVRWQCSNVYASDVESKTKIGRNEGRALSRPRRLFPFLVSNSIKCLMWVQVNLIRFLDRIQ